MEVTIHNTVELTGIDERGAMSKLTARERDFVLALVFQTNGNQTEAAEIAGYSSKTREGLRVYGHAVAHRPKIQDAIKEVVRSAINADGPAALFAVRQVLFSPNAKNGDKLKAAKILMDKGILPDKQEIMHSGTVHLDMVARVKEVRRRAEALGIDARKFLGAAGDIPQEVIDAEFEEVKTVNGAQGLEDVL